MIGKRFGKLLVVDSDPKKDKHLMWKCLCDCGNTTSVRGSSLRGNRTKSCGCLQKESVTIHGGKGTRLYQTWVNMRRRCTDPNAKDYKNYGALGVTYIKEWDDFSVFRDWAMSNGYQDHLTIDRKKVEGNYEPDNCRWSDWSTQAANQRKGLNKSSKYLGVTKRNGRWEASVKRFGKSHYVGTFDNEEDAAKARDAYIIENNWPHKLNNLD